MAPRVLVTRDHLPGDGVTRLRKQDFTVVLPETRDIPPAEELARLAAEADGVLAMGPDAISEVFLDAAGPSLKVVSLASVGFEKVDLPGAVERGIVVTNTPDVLADTTADLAFALILAARRRLLTSALSLRAGEWDAFRMDGYLGLDVYGTTLGLIGYGQIAQAVARRAGGFGMRVVYHTRTPRPPDGLATPVDLAVLLAESDIVSVHTPLTDQTRGMIGSAELASMKSTATLVNTARGGIVDENALLDALARGVIHSAGFDVFAQEPLRDNVSRLVAESRLLPLPHVGSATEQTRERMVGLAADNLIEVLSERPALTPVPGSTAVPDPQVQAR